MDESCHTGKGLLVRILMESAVAISPVDGLVVPIKITNDEPLHPSDSAVTSCPPIVHPTIIPFVTP